MQMRLKRDDLGGFFQHGIGIQPLIRFIRADRNIDTIAEADSRVFEARHVALREECEAIEQLCLNVLPAGVDVRRCKIYAGTRFQKLAGIIREDISVAAHFMHRPAAAAFAHEGRIIAGDAGGPDHMVEHVAGTDGLAAIGLFLNVVHFPNLDGFNPAVLFEPQGSGFQFTPIIGSACLDRYFRSGNDQIRLSEGPLIVVTEGTKGRHVGRVAFGSAIVGPFGNSREFVFAQGEVVLVMLNADIFFNEVGRHDPSFVPQRGAFFDGFSPWPRLLVCHECHGGQALLVVAVLTAALQDRRNILRERGDCGIGSDRQGGGRDQGSNGKSKRKSGHG